MNSKNFIAILRNILRMAFRIKLRKILRTLVNEVGLPDFQKAKPGHNLFSKKMLIVMLSNFKFVSITYRQNIQNT